MATHRGRARGPVPVLLLLGLLATVWAACEDDATRNPTAPAATAISPRFEDVPCIGLLSREIERARCGYLVVPENRARADTRAIRLAVTVLPATGDATSPDPLVYLTGGPGYSELYGELDRWLQFAAPVRATRDLVFFDQRGAGESRPGLYCPEVRDQLLASLDQRVPSAADATAAIGACRDVLLRSGIDLSAYSSAAIAADLADLMHTLGYREWNLFGLSYGARIALTVMRDRPDGLRSVVLDSPVPPQVHMPADAPANFERSLDLLIEACATDQLCAAAYPDLRDVTLELVARLNEEPVAAEPVDPATGRATKVLVTGDRLIVGTQFALRDATAYGGIPAVAYALHRGEYGLLAQAAGGIIFGYGGRADGMAISVACSEDTPFLTAEVAAAGTQGVQADVARALGVDVDRELAICEAWGLDAPPAAENEPVTSEVPVLLLAGLWDPITPPSYAHLAAETLRRSTVVEFPVTGHAVIYSRSECAISIVAAFVADPLAAPDAACASQIGPPAFVVP